jgi:hypothetical protein
MVASSCSSASSTRRWSQNEWFWEWNYRPLAFSYGHSASVFRICSQCLPHNSIASFFFVILSRQVATTNNTSDAHTQYEYPFECDCDEQFDDE